MTTQVIKLYGVHASILKHPVNWATFTFMSGATTAITHTCWEVPVICRPIFIYLSCQSWCHMLQTTDPRRCISYGSL